MSMIDRKTARAPAGAAATSGAGLAGAAGAVALGAAALCLPFARYVPWAGDEGVLVLAARRMLDGERLYRDLFEFLPPLPYELVAGWMRLAGRSLVAVRALAIATIALTAAAIFVAAARASRRRAWPAALALAWVLSGVAERMVVNHRYFAALASMIAVALVSGLPARATRRCFGAGLALGAATVTTPTAALVGLAALAALIAGRRRRESAALVGGALVAPVAMALQLAAQGTLAVAADTGLRFLAHRYASIQGLPYGTGVGPETAILAAAFPAALALAVACVAVEGRAALADADFRTTALVALAGFAYCLPRADVSHLCFGAPLAVPLVVVAARRLGERSSGLRWPGRALAAALLVTTAVAYVDRAVDEGTLPSLALPAGRTRPARSMDPDQLAMLAARIATLPPGDRFFFYPYDPLLPFLLGRRVVAPVDIFTPGYTWPSQYRASCEAVLARADWVVVDGTWADPAHTRRTWPAIADAYPPETAAFERAIASAFTTVLATPRYELRRRNPGSDTAVCRAIDDEARRR